MNIPDINGDASKQIGTLRIASKPKFRNQLARPNGNLFSSRKTKGVRAIHG